jgi:hypothetical protein
LLGGFGCVEALETHLGTAPSFLAQIMVQIPEGPRLDARDADLDLADVGPNHLYILFGLSLHGGGR